MTPQTLRDCLSRSARRHLNRSKPRGEWLCRQVRCAPVRDGARPNVTKHTDSGSYQDAKALWQLAEQCAAFIVGNEAAYPPIPTRQDAAELVRYANMLEARRNGATPHQGVHLRLLRSEPELALRPPLSSE